jgi:hypothetical protein
MLGIRSGEWLSLAQFPEQFNTLHAVGRTTQQGFLLPQTITADYLLSFASLEVPDVLKALA